MISEFPTVIRCFIVLMMGFIYTPSSHMGRVCHIQGLDQIEKLKEHVIVSLDVVITNEHHDVHLCHLT